MLTPSRLLRANTSDAQPVHHFPRVLKPPVHNAQENKDAYVDTCVVLAKQRKQQLSDKSAKDIGHYNHKEITASSEREVVY